jgi:hypothetical protein
MERLHLVVLSPTSLVRGGLSMLSQQEGIKVVAQAETAREAYTQVVAWSPHGLLVDSDVSQLDRLVIRVRAECPSVKIVLVEGLQPESSAEVEVDLKFSRVTEISEMVLQLRALQRH